MRFVPRVSGSGAYRDCRWCQGRGCISCEVEADKEYKRQFPDGPKPIATFPIEPGQTGLDVLKKLLGPGVVIEMSDDKKP